MKYKNVLVMFFFFLWMAITAYANNSEQMNAEKIYSENQPNIVVNAKQPIFQIQLKSNPTTGYSWFLQNYDHHLMTLIKHQFVRPQSGLMGAGGYETWTFRVKISAFTMSQKTTLQFIYARPWEMKKTTNPLTFSVMIQGNHANKNR